MGALPEPSATLVFVKAGWFPLVVRNRDRKRYLDALEAADDGNLADLVAYFAGLQRAEFVKALSIAEDVLTPRRVEDAIASVRQRLAKRRDSLVAEWESAKSIAAHLCNQSERRLAEVAEQLRVEMQGVLEHAEFFADCAADGDRNSHYFRSQILQSAKPLGYFA